MSVSGILLGTSAYSAFRRGHPGIKKEVQEADEIILTPIILGELYAGFRRGRRLHENREELDRFLSSPRAGIAEITPETAERYATILDGLRGAGTPIPTNDIWIAASAMERGLRVVTTDSHYKSVSEVVVRLHEPA